MLKDKKTKWGGGESKKLTTISKPLKIFVNQNFHFFSKTYLVLYSPYNIKNCNTQVHKTIWKLEQSSVIPTGSNDPQRYIWAQPQVKVGEKGNKAEERTSRKEQREIGVVVRECH